MKVAKEILDLVPYRPGKPIEETKRELGLSEVIKLASNENPLGPSPKVLEALRLALADLHRYPDAASFELRQAYSKFYGVAPEYLTFGNGSNELIDLLIHLYCEPESEILVSEAAFVAYRISAQAARVKVREVPMDSQMKFQLKKMADVLAADSSNQIRLVFLPNPNNPTGTYFSHAELTEFMKVAGQRPNTLVILDEAYLEYVRADDFPKALDFLKTQPNFVILRTMSKIFGIAGLRLGALIARPEVIDLVNRIRNPFNVNSLAQVAGLAAVQDRDHLERVKSLTWEGLDYFYTELKRLQLPYWESQGNFVLFDSLRDSQQIFQSILRKGVIVRPVDNYGLKSHIRLSVGLPHENQQAIRALESALTELPQTKMS